MFILQPFESFEIVLTKIGFRSFFINFFLINSSFVLLFIVIILIIIFYGILSDQYILISFKRYLVTNVVKFAINQVKNQTGYQITPWLSLFVLYFFFILIFDYIGLLPFQLTLTSQFNYVLIPTASIFLGLTIRIITDNFKVFISHFVPSGIPKAIGAFLFVIEIISYFFRGISLPVRVFANMVAGHVLLFLMATALTINFESLDSFSLKISLIFILFIWFAVFHLELLVSYLQAYVFLTMISIYAKDLGKNSFQKRQKKENYFLSKYKKVINV